MATNELYESIERAALAAYGELLSPELAHAAATAFAKETTQMVEDLLNEGSGKLRDQIEGQLATLQKSKGKKKRPAKKSPRQAKKSTPPVAAQTPAPAEVSEPEVVEAAPKSTRKKAATA